MRARVCARACVLACVCCWLLVPHSKTAAGLAHYHALPHVQELPTTRPWLWQFIKRCCLLSFARILAYHSEQAGLLSALGVKPGMKDYPLSVSPVALCALALVVLSADNADMRRALWEGFVAALTSQVCHYLFTVRLWRVMLRCNADFR